MGGNIYRNRIRKKNQFASFLFYFKYLVVIVTVVGGFYYVYFKSDFIDSIKAKGQVSFEEIVEYPYSDIGKIIIKSNKTEEDINEFINRYQNKIYKINNKDSLFVKSEVEVYYVYDTNGKFIYEVHDLGNNSIGIQPLTGYMKVYDLVQ